MNKTIRRVDHMYDLHIHSNYSIDSRFSMEDMTLSAINKNLKTICFADRIDLNYTANKIDLSFRIDDYIKNINRVKYRYLKEIEVLAGLEIGMQPHLGDRYKEIINNYPLDYIIMTIHSINGKDIFIDHFLDKLDPDEALYLYYLQIYNCVKDYDDYDALGIFDAIDRYLGKEYKAPNYEDYYPLISDILSILISKGKSLEVNSSGLRFGLDYFHPKLPILKLYKDLGGENITIGSSSNTGENIGYQYKILEKKLKLLGFKYIHIYRKRKKIPIQIS